MHTARGKEDESRHPHEDTREDVASRQKEDDKGEKSREYAARHVRPFQRPDRQHDHAGVRPAGRA